MQRWPLALFFLVVLLAAGNARAVDADGDGLDDAQETTLLQTYAPELFFHPDERYFPTTVQFDLDHSRLERYNATAPVVVDANPTAASIAAYNTPADPQSNPEGIYFLNDTLGSTRDDSGILTAYRTGSYPKVVYGHVTPDGSQTVVQYWFHYAYNPGAWDNHESDWEMITVVLTGTNPVLAGYSQHESGEQLAWSDVTKSGTHPSVYVALGSHANYFRPFEGHIGLAGDSVSDGGARWSTGDYQIVNVGERSMPMAGNEWLRFAGRWGEWFPAAEARGEGGPAGPGYRSDGEMFQSPAQWTSRLDVPSPNLLLLEWLLANLFTIFLAVLALFFVLKIVRIVLIQRRTKAGLKIWPLAHLFPFDRKSLAMVLGIVGLVIGIASFLLPWYVMTVDANAPGFLVTNGPQEFLRVDGVSGVTVNPFKPGGGLVHLTIFPLPIGLMLAVTTAYFFLKIAGTKTSRRLGVRFLTKGIVAVLPFILVIIIAALLLPNLGSSGTAGQPDATTVFGPIAAHPFGGTTTVSVDNGSATFAWGLGTGAWLMIVSAVVLFVAAGLAMSQKYAFLPQWYVDGHKSPEDAAAAAAAALAATGATILPPPPPPEPVPEAPPAPLPSELAPPLPTEPAPFVPTVEPPAAPAAGRACPRCGASVAANAAFCGSCGLTLG